MPMWPMILIRPLYDRGLIIVSAGANKKVPSGLAPGVIDVRESSEHMGNPFPARMPGCAFARPGVITYATLNNLSSQAVPITKKSMAGPFCKVAQAQSITAVRYIFARSAC